MHKEKGLINKIMDGSIYYIACLSNAYIYIYVRVCKFLYNTDCVVPAGVKKKELSYEQTRNIRNIKNT